MQPVQVQCVSCGKRMAVSPEHLGTFVQCPHCMVIMQAPPVGLASSPAPPPLSPPAPPAAPQMTAPAGGDVRDRFFGAPQIQSDSLFGSSQLSEAEVLAATTAHATTSTTPATFSVTEPEPAPAHQQDLAPPSGSSTTFERVRRPRRNSLFVPLLLIFLIPYSVVCTIYIAWTLLHPARGFHSLELLPDPKPGEGGPRRIDPQAPLPGKLKTSLGNPIQIGSLEVTPRKVELREGDLVIFLDLVNKSEDVSFNPIHESFVRYVDRKPKPYTYLQTSNGALYGATCEWRPDKAAGEQAAETGIIGPGQRMTVVLGTRAAYREEIRKVMKSPDLLLWRVQVRRGFVTIDDRDTPATAVIGVEFTPAQVERPQVAAGWSFEPLAIKSFLSRSRN